MLDHDETRFDEFDSLYNSQFFECLLNAVLGAFQSSLAKEQHWPGIPYSKQMQVAPTQATIRNSNNSVRRVQYGWNWMIFYSDFERTLEHHRLHHLYNH